MIRKPIPYGRQEITSEDVAVVTETLLSDFLTQGPQIKAFETAFADYVGARYAVAVNNATAALHLAVKAMNIQPGDKVIVPPVTFAASANCVRFCEGEVVFCDIDKDSYLIDLLSVKSMLETAPRGTYKGIIAVDFAGYPVNTKVLRELADEYGLWIVDDACHAPGGFFFDSKGEKHFCGGGNLADATVFSFHPVKHIATGEGGMITTDDAETYNKLCLLRSHGITKDPGILKENHGGWYYEMTELGFNYRLTDLQAALGISQLSRAADNLSKRHAIANRYNNAFNKIPGIRTPRVEPSVYHAYHLYIIQVENRKELYDFLHSNGIYAQVHYIPLHLMPYYKQLGAQKGDFPVAEAYYEHCLSLPMYPTLTQEEQDFVIEKVISFVK